MKLYPRSLRLPVTTSVVLFFLAMVTLFGQATLGCLSAQESESEQEKRDDKPSKQKVIGGLNKFSFKLPKKWKERKSSSFPNGGFSTAFEYPGGLVATLYQYKRDYQKLDAKKNWAFAKKEMDRAVSGIKMAQEQGYWKGVKEISSEVLEIGKEKKKVLFKEFELKVEGGTVQSLVFVWIDQGRFFKVRCTSHWLGKKRPRKKFKQLVESFTKPQKDSAKKKSDQATKEK